MNKFKVGDRVLCLHNCEPGKQFTKDRVYQVRRLADTWGSIGVVADDSGNENGWCEDFFELFDENRRIEITPAQILSQNLEEVENLIDKLRFVIKEIRYQVGKR